MLDKLFYNLSLQGGRRFANLHSLLTGDAFTLDRVGVADDSVRRLVSVMNAQHIPLSSDLVPESQQRENLSALARFDWRKSATVNANVVASVRHASTAAQMLSSTAVPGHGGRDASSGADVSATLSTYLRTNFLSDLRLGAQFSDSRGTPYLDLPDAPAARPVHAQLPPRT